MSLPDPQDVPQALEGIGYNAMYLPDLVRQCQRGGIVPFVGAGLSAPFGFPQWGPFLLSTAVTDEMRRAIQRKLDALEYAEAASLVVERLERRLFEDLLQRAFNDDRLRSEPVAGAVARLVEFPSGPVVTTNFDHVIETAFAQARKPLRSVWHAQAVKGVEALQRNESFLLKLHGDWQDSDNRVLTLEEYELAYGDTAGRAVDSQRPVPQLLHILLSSRSCLFLGCSLKQDRTMLTLKSVADSYKTKHYALVSRPADDAEFAARTKELSALGIAPIWYPPGQHAWLDPILQFLAGKSATPAARVTASPTNRPEPRHNIPTLPNPTVGRAEEIRQIADLLKGARLVTLFGGGGCGKSRVAIEVARALRYDYPEGTWFVDLSELSEKADQENLLPARIGTIADIPQQPSRPPLDGLVERFSVGRHLLVLDNCEHLATSCRLLLKELLRQCPTSLQVLATSRAVLAIPEERVYPLATLQPPEADAPLDLLRENEAVQLFRARAGKDFVLTAENAAAVAGLCRALDGIPLAIEVAAARLGVRSVHQLNKQSRALLDALEGVEIDDLRHWRTVNAALDWSYKLLAKPLRDFVRPLALFDGGWTEESAARIHAGAKTAPDTAKFLQRLLDQSIILSRDSGETVRFRFLEPVRQFMRDKLKPAEAQQYGRLHAALFTDLAEQAGPELLKADQQRWLTLLQLEADNLRAALRWSIAHGDVQSALRMTGSIWRFMEIRGYFTEGRERTAEVLAMPGTDAWPPLLEATLSGAGWLAFRQSDLPEAERLVRAALMIAEQLGLTQKVANALNDLGTIARIRGRYAEGREQMLRSLEVVRGAGDTRMTAVLLNNLGANALDDGDLMEASIRLGESLELFRQAGNTREVAFPLRYLAEVALHRGDLALARDYARESLDLRVVLRDSKGQADTLSTLAWLEVEDGNLSEASTHLTKSLEFAKAIGDRRTVSEALEIAALLHARRGQLGLAVQLLGGIARVRARIGFVSPPSKVRFFEPILREAKHTLGDGDYDALWQRGESRDVNALIELAVNPSGPR